MLKRREIMAVVPMVMATLVMATLVMARVAAADGYICVFSTRCYEETGCSYDSPITITIDEAGRNQPLGSGPINFLRS